MVLPPLLGSVLAKRWKATEVQNLLWQWLLRVRNAFVVSPSLHDLNVLLVTQSAGESPSASQRFHVMLIHPRREERDLPHFFPVKTCCHTVNVIFLLILSLTVCVLPDIQKPARKRKVNKCLRRSWKCKGGK